MNAQDFFNLVTLMRANQREYYRLGRKKDRTPEEEERRQQHFKNALHFEGVVDQEIERVQQILQRKEQEECQQPTT